MLIHRLFFRTSIFSKHSFINTLRMSSSLDTDQDRQFVGPDLGQNCLQRLAADNIGRQRVNTLFIILSVCAEYNHVRTWSVTRFRGMISTQPGSTPMASFKVVSLEEFDPQQSYIAGNDFGKSCVRV